MKTICFNVRRPVGVVWIVILVFAVLYGVPGRACTTALWGFGATGDGAPMLWKNRDTDILSNKAVYVAAQPLPYLGLIDAGDPSRQVWAGVNEAGLAIFNSVAYNLPMQPQDAKDQEGFIMADILRTCRSVADVEEYFATHLGENLGTQANFGVMDGAGSVVLLEASAHSCAKIDIASLPEKFLVNTNFARSGTAGRGAGYLRFTQTSSLLKDVPPRDITPQFVMNRLARDVGHPLITTRTWKELATISDEQPVWASTADTINRASTSATVIVQGKQPTDGASRATFWVALGEPLAALAIPLWVEARQTPALLREGKNAPLYLESQRVSKLFRPFSEEDKINYIRLTRLVNRENTGTLPPLVAAQNRIFAATAAFLQTHPHEDELAAFSERMAQLAFRALRELH